MAIALPAAVPVQAAETVVRATFVCQVWQLKVNPQTRKALPPEFAYYGEVLADFTIDEWDNGAPQKTVEQAYLERVGAADERAKGDDAHCEATWPRDEVDKKLANFKAQTAEGVNWQRLDIPGPLFTPQLWFCTRMLTEQASRGSGVVGYFASVPAHPAVEKEIVQINFGAFVEIRDQGAKGLIEPTCARESRDYIKQRMDQQRKIRTYGLPWGELEFPRTL